MPLDLLKRLLAVPTYSRQEQPMVDFLLKHVRQRGPGLCGVAMADPWNNVLIRKGNAKVVPCVCAHIDTVHKLIPAEIVQQGGALVGFNAHGHRAGIGADDKCGVYICLELLERCQNLAVALFAQEEIGYIGAKHAQSEFFQDLGYALEFDAPAHGLVSYTSGGVRLFQNDGEFIQTALPVLARYGFTHFQHHPFTDVKALRQRFTMSCLNLSCGYHHWHRNNESVHLAEVESSLAMATELIVALGNRRYDYDPNLPESAQPPVEVTALIIAAS